MTLATELYEDALTSLRVQGAISTFAVTAEDVYVFGLNNYGQLAIPEEQGREIYLPVRADALAGAF